MTDNETAPAPESDAESDAAPDSAPDAASDAAPDSDSDSAPAPASDDKGSGKRPRSVRRRTAARLAGIQTLFQAAASGQPLTEILPGFRQHFLPQLLTEFGIERLDEDHYTRIISAASSDGAAIDAVIALMLNEGWTLERISAVERAVLRLAYVELRDAPHIPARAVIAEYTALAETCGADGGFINAILDRQAREIRCAEMESSTG